MHECSAEISWRPQHLLLQWDLGVGTQNVQESSLGTGTAARTHPAGAVGQGWGGKCSLENSALQSMDPMGAAASVAC